jgi:hypothetical protein
MICQALRTKGGTLRNFLPLLLLGCTTTNLTIVELPDAGPLADVTPDARETLDAGQDTGATLAPDATVALDGGEGAAPEAGPTSCITPNLPPSWGPSAACTTASGASHDCPSCLPYWYLCSDGGPAGQPGGAWPVAFDGGETLYVPDSGLWAGEGICSDTPTCVRARAFDISCVGLQAYICAPLLDGGATTVGLPSLPLCEVSSFAPTGWCCQ